MSNQVLDIVRIVRRMRGGSQACLVQASDEKFYVAKFAGNPQSNRTLINECIASKIIKSLNVPTPAIAVLRLGPEIKLGSESPCFEMGSKKILVKPGLHLGSQCPVDPENTAIFDFLPSKLLQKTKNLGDFAKMMVLDIFVGQADSRQAIFVRDHSRRNMLFETFMIDHGMIFGGSRWDLLDLPGREFYFDREIYSMVNTDAICDQAIRDLDNLVTEEALFEAARDIPGEWFASDDYDALANLFLRLLRRKAQLRALVANQLQELGLASRHERSLEFKSLLCEPA